MKKLFGIVLAATMILLVSAACGTASAAEPTPALESVQPASLLAEGRLYPLNALDSSFSVSGQVAEVLVRDGDRVEAGQVLARLESFPETQAALAKAEQEALAAQQAIDALERTAEQTLAESKLALIAAQEAYDTAATNLDYNETDENQALLDKAAADLTNAEEMQTKLAAEGGIDPDQMAAAEARWKSANAAAASTQASIDALALTAPMDGTVVDLTLQPGERVSAGQPVVTVADFSGWVMKTTNLTETEVVNVTVGQEVNLTIDALPGKTWAGTVTHINARFEETRGDITYTVTITLNESDPLMRWGMTTVAQFVR